MPFILSSSLTRILVGLMLVGTWHLGPPLSEILMLGVTDTLHAKHLQLRLFFFPSNIRLSFTIFTIDDEF